jgi:hypothetical protein
MTVHPEEEEEEEEEVESCDHISEPIEPPVDHPASSLRDLICFTLQSPELDSSKAGADDRSLESVATLASSQPDQGEFTTQTGAEESETEIDDTELLDDLSPDGDEHSSAGHWVSAAALSDCPDVDFVSLADED